MSKKMTYNFKSFSDIEEASLELFGCKLIFPSEDNEDILINLYNTNEIDMKIVENDKTGNLYNSLWCYETYVRKNKEKAKEYFFKSVNKGCVKIVKNFITLESNRNKDDAIITLKEAIASGSKLNCLKTYLAFLMISRLKNDPSNLHEIINLVGDPVLDNDPLALMIKASILGYRYDYVYALHGLDLAENTFNDLKWDEQYHVDAFKEMISNFRLCYNQKMNSDPPVEELNGRLLFYKAMNENYLQEKIRLLELAVSLEEDNQIFKNTLGENLLKYHTNSKTLSYEIILRIAKLMGNEEVIKRLIGGK